MQSASAIMRKKRVVRKEMERRLSKAQSDELWAKAEAKLGEIQRQFADISAGEHVHTDGYIFPSAALYLTLSEDVGRETAYSVIESAAIRNSSSAGRKLAKLMRIPGMTNLFVRIWDPLTRRMFSENNGFKNVFYPRKKGEYRMDVVSCPYCKYFAALGCPELTKIFCANDVRVYGNLPGVEFKRTGTLGTGADRCDFYISRA